VFDVLTEWKTQIALKCFEKKSHLSDIKIKKAFYNEIQIMQQLNNPHIISYDYLFETEKAYYLKMEFL
jgi:serine/threonine protein kinase